MITQIRGRLVERNPTDVVVDCNGVGYLLHISLNTFAALPSDENVTLYSHLVVKEKMPIFYMDLLPKQKERFLNFSFQFRVLVPASQERCYHQ